MSYFEDSITGALQDLRRRISDLELVTRPDAATLVLKTTTITAGNGLTGGGDLSVNRTISLGTPSTLSATTGNTLLALSHQHAITTSSAAAVSTIVATNASGYITGKLLSGSVIDHGGWINMAGSYNNAWVDFNAPGGTFNPGQYYKDQMGFVHLRGLVKTGTVNVSMFTLPSGYRPLSGRLIFPTSSSVGGVPTFVRVDVIQDGNIYQVSAPAGANVAQSLDGIYFYAG